MSSGVLGANDESGVGTGELRHIEVNAGQAIGAGFGGEGVFLCAAIEGDNDVGAGDVLAGGVANEDVEGGVFAVEPVAGIGEFESKFGGRNGSGRRMLRGRSSRRPGGDGRRGEVKSA